MTDITGNAAEFSEEKVGRTMLSETFSKIICNKTLEANDKATPKLKVKFAKIVTNYSNATKMDFIKNVFDYTIKNSDTGTIINEMNKVIESCLKDDIKLITVSDSSIHTIATTSVNTLPGQNYAIIYVSTKNYLISSLGYNIYNDKKILCINGDDVSYSDENIIYYGISKKKEILQTFINNFITNKKVHVIIDCADILKPVMSNIFDILKNIKDTINVLEFLWCVDKKAKNNIRAMIVNLFHVPEKKINIYNENSEILIYRPLGQEDELDNGWYLLRGVDEQNRERLFTELIKKNWVELDVDGEVILISKTSINYQNNFTYFDNNILVEDKVLFPSEKMDLGFELINH